MSKKDFDKTQEKNNNSKSSGIVLGKLHDLIGEKFGNYSRYIIQDRALPNINDGLKPVQRRILYSMHKLKMNHKNPYKKSARIVGDVIGKYHPHGDSSVYEAMIRMSQEWKMNVPLIDMHGNKGSVDGDSAAAMRYTETRLQEITQFVLGDIDKGIVKMNPNFDDSEWEPTVLPSLIPNLLINGATGIASGYSTSIPPHNFNEVLEGLIALMKNNDITIKEMIKIIKGPDFPTGGIVERKQDILSYFKKGTGKIFINSKINYDKKTNSLVITEIPFGVNKAVLVKKIDDLINSSQISTIKEVIDETDKKGLQISVVLKPNVNYESVISFLFKKTDLRKSFSVNMVAIKDRSPQTFSLMSYLHSFKTFTIANYLKIYKFELEKIANRLEIVEGIIKAIPILDEIIVIIRASSNKAEARMKIIQRFGFSEIQAEAILNMKLYRLTSSDIYLLKEEQKELLELEKHYHKGVDSEEYLTLQIIKVLEEINEKYLFPRRSKLIRGNDETTLSFNAQDLIKEEKVKVIITSKNNIKILLEEEWGKKSKIAIDDLEIFNFEANSFESLFVLTSFGKYYSIELFKIKIQKAKDMGENISNYFSFAPNENIINIMVAKENDLKEKNRLLIATKNSLIKKIEYDSFSMSTSKAGAKLIKLAPEDNVVEFRNIHDDDSLINVVTKNGYILRYPSSNVSISKFSSQGVTNIKLEDGDEVIGIVVQTQNKINTNDALIFVSKEGIFKKIVLNVIRETNRGKKGQKITSTINPNLLRVFSEEKQFNKISFLTEAFKAKSLLKTDLKLIKSTSSKIEHKIDNKIILINDGTFIKIIKENKKEEKPKEIIEIKKNNDFFNF